MNKTLKISLTLAVLIAGAAACGPGAFMSGNSSSGGKTWENSLREIFPDVQPKTTELEEDDPKQIEAQVLKDATLTCENEKDCSESVGMLITLSAKIETAGEKRRKKYEALQCSGFLIADDIFVTSSQCIPDSIKADAEHCEGFAWVTFQKERVGCERVMLFSDIASDDETQKKPNYAFIRLKKKVLNKPLVTQTTGIENKTLVHIYKVNPHPTKWLEGSIEKTECVSVYHAPVLPIESAIAKVMTFRGCQALPGNQGAPILVDTDGKEAVIAILNGSLQVPQKKQGFVQVIEVGTNLSAPDEALRSIVH